MTAGKFPQPAIFLAAAWLPMAAATAVSQTDFGPVNVGASAAMTVTLTIPSAVTLGGISVATQGVPGLDFTNAGSGTCAAGASYPAGQCTVEVTFKPAFAGKRYGEVLLEGGSGNVIVTANLEGIGSGAQIGFDPGTAIAIDPTVNGNGLKIPFGTAVDGEGNLFITDTIHRRVLEMPAGGGAPIAIDPVVNGEGLSNPGGVTVDGAGDLFISDLDNNFVVELPAGGGAPIAIDPVVNGIGLDYPCGMVVDGAGNLFIADVDKGRVVEVPAGGGAPIAIDPMVNGEKLSYPVTLALDSAGDLFIADEFGQRVVEVPDVAENPSGAGATAIAPMVNGQSFYQPYGVAVDAAGDLFIADAGNDRIVEVPGGGGAPTAFDPTVNGGGLSDPIGIALDAAGDLFIADSLNNRVVEVERSQPPALNFAAAPIGSASSDSPQTVEVENIGNAPLTFSVPATGGNPAVAANFTLDSSGTSACPLVTQGSSEPGTLAAGAACLLPISFAPTAAGSLYGTLTLTDDNLNAAAPGYAVQTVSLSGDAPVASLSAANLWFGAQELGTASAAQQVTLTNAGSAALTITSIAVSGTDASSFLFPNLCGPSLAAGANCVIQGTFKPAAAGPLTAQLTLTDNAGGSTQTIALTGTGVYTPAVMVTPSASSITTAQALTVTVAVSGESGDPPPTGAVTLTIGSYVSAPAALLSGSASIGVPAGSLAVGTDSIVAAYTPDIASSNLYSTASGSSSVVVTAASTAAAPAAT
ncbi:MAG: choice-of-anchor D domain-containing protein, partial [Terracidiphilus sp.]